MKLFKRKCPASIKEQSLYGQNTSLESKVKNSEYKMCVKSAPLMEATEWSDFTFLAIETHNAIMLFAHNWSIFSFIMCVIELIIPLYLAMDLKCQLVKFDTKKQPKQYHLDASDNVSLQHYQNV